MLGVWPPVTFNLTFESALLWGQEMSLEGLLVPWHHELGLCQRVCGKTRMAKSAQVPFVTWTEVRAIPPLQVFLPQHAQALPLGGTPGESERCAVGGGPEASACGPEPFEMQSCSCRGRPRASARLLHGKLPLLTSLARPEL